MATASLEERFVARFSRAPDVIASAPGRVNLIGEHTDYNDGFALPMAIEPRTRVALAVRTDTRLHVFSEAYHEWFEASEPPRDHLEVAGPHGVPGQGSHWHRYVVAVERSLREVGMPATGFDILIDAGVREGVGLSSSAALEIALARAMQEGARAPWDPTAAARAAQRAENEYVGVRCGIMDQLASASAIQGHAMLMDFRTLAIEQVELPRDVAIVVMDTGVRRSLATSDYNARRAACERAVAVVRDAHRSVRALRDVDADMLAEVAPRLDAEALDCARHVVGEIARPTAFRAALLNRDFQAAGILMNASHASLRDLYRVSSPHLDAACEVACSHPACLGARMTGAGFGGSAIALVRADGAEDFLTFAIPQYEARTYSRGTFYAVSPVDGARLERARDQ